MPQKRQSLKSRAEPPTGNAALYKVRSLSSLKAYPAWYALLVGGRETGRCLSGNRFFHSQIKHWASWQISTLMRFFERPGGFVDVIIPQIVQKEKRQTRKPAASMRFT